MRRIKQWLVVMLTFSMVFSGLMLRTSAAEAAVNDYVSVTKTVSPTTLTTEDTADVTLNITGTPPVNVVVPNDVVLIIDKSGSMAPGYNNGEDKMANAKDAAKGFVDLMDMTKHRVAVVDFSSTNMIGSIPFTTDKDIAKNYINGIQANGGTATGDAIQTAINLLEDHRTEAQPVIVIMTDGDANQPSNDPYGYAKQRAQNAKDAGIITYTVALLQSSENPDTSGPNILLKEMATTAAHHHFVLGSTGLAEMYAAIVKEIGLASAFDVAVTDIVDPNFEIVPGSADNNIPKPTITGNTLTWDFNELKNSTLSFNYKIRPVSKTKTGTFPISTASSVITYKDYAGASRSKSIPSVNVNVKLPAPQVTSLDKSYGHPKGGETVVINGNHFVNGATVQFGTMRASNVVFVSDTQLTATAPAGKQGIVSVTVTNLDSQQASASYQYKADPIVAVIDPNNGPLDGGTLVYVTGNYFMSGISVFFGDKPASVIYMDSTYLKVTSPKVTTPGPVDLIFMNPDRTSAVVSGGYTYNEPPKTDPEITSVIPNTGVITGGNQVYVNGKNFKSGMTIFIGGKQASATYVSASQFLVTIPAGDSVGTVDVAVADLNNNLFTLTGAYTYTAVQYPIPTITSIVPNTGLVAGGETIYVNGTNFVNGISQVMIGGKPASTTYMSRTSLRVIVPAGDAPGKVDVKAINDTNEAVLTQGYEYMLPAIKPVTVTTVSPNQGKVMGGDIVYIYGTNFMSGATVAFGSNIASSTYVNATTIKTTVPAGAAAGKVDVTVTNPDGGTATLPQGYQYTIVTPTITSLSPNHGNKTGGDVIYVNGSNFASGANVTINGVNATVTFMNSTSLKAIVPSSPQSASATFTYDNGPVLPAPKITSMSPTTSPVGSLVYVNGLNFASTSKVYFGGVQATTIYMNSKSLKVNVPSGSGVVNVTVVNADGQTSNAVSFTIN
ncbi:IPT/TIG domain-containing protein [Paenibacillus sp. Root444D2]|uniref:IPT/TIG domain-containing protein n=1 Tax=Paenibacillus sp. Root444D2 TaxID=1736538 RepID=UPI000710A7B4|nr:IPT/TIG domain-containing protein [Paenibacillus sp. Root444D2]KQX63829.1 hypothetical protein ASD40_29260 [Paenibacillus sp. Root444D2]